MEDEISRLVQSKKFYEYPFILEKFLAAGAFPGILTRMFLAIFRGEFAHCNIGGYSL